MNDLPGNLGGNDPIVPWLNKLRAAVASSRLTSVVNGRMARGPGGTQLICGGKAAPATSDVSGVERFRVKSVQDDYLTCRTWDGTTEGGSDVLIAKAPKLRHSVASESIEGVTVSYTYSSRTNNEDGKRVATDGTVSQTEIVIPVWIDNDEIFATKPLRGTDVVVSSVELEYLDLNVDGRVWGIVG